MQILWYDKTVRIPVNETRIKRNMRIGKYRITTRKQKQRLAIVIAAGLLILVLLLSMAGLMVCGGLYIHDRLQTSPTSLPEEAAEPAGTDASAIPNPSATVILDPGHGGKDGGCSGTLDGKELVEAELVFDISLKLKALLEEKNIEVLLTRSREEEPTLKERAVFSQKSGADLFVSLHCNSYEEDRTVCGLECYYEKSDKESKVLAETIFAAAKDSGMVDVRDMKSDMMYVVRYAGMPAVLVETGYLSNPAECRKFSSEGYRSILAEVIAEGIETVLNRNDENEV